VTPIGKPVTRVTIGTHHGRQLVATLGPGDVLYRKEIAAELAEEEAGEAQ
jgi:hypothetical protein